MKHSCAFVMICIGLILLCLTGPVIAVSQDYDKSVSIALNIDDNTITVKSSEIYYGSAPNLVPGNGGFKGKLVAADGSTVKTFTVWDPRVQFGDSIVDTADGPRIAGLVERKGSADFLVIFPYDREVTEFRLYTPDERTLLSSVNMKSMADSFFADYPKDPDNPALQGSKAPVAMDPARTGTQDPGITSSGQFNGILLIAAGVGMLLGAGFASFQFLRKKTKSILIVDDNRDIIDVINGMLKKNGYVTRTAMSGAECLTELGSAVPNLILLDIGMEPMDGWETLKTIKKNPKTRDIPVIMLTARKLEPKDVENYGIFIEDYVMKPVTSQELNAAILHVFSRQQMIRDEIAAARDAGINQEVVCECARLTRVVDVYKRLSDLLVATYEQEARRTDGRDEVTMAVKNIEEIIQDKKHRLEQLRYNHASGVTR